MTHSLVGTVSLPVRRLDSCAESLGFAPSEICAAGQRMSDGCGGKGPLEA